MSIKTTIKYVLLLSKYCSLLDFVFFKIHHYDDKINHVPQYSF